MIILAILARRTSRILLEHLGKIVKIIDPHIGRYGEICSQQVAAKILGVVPRTIARMMEEGRLRRVGRRVDVRSIAAYIENPEQANFEAKVRKGAPTSRLSEGTFLAAAKAGRWAGRR